MSCHFYSCVLAIMTCIFKFHQQQNVFPQRCHSSQLADEIGIFESFDILSFEAKVIEMLSAEMFCSSVRNVFAVDSFVSSIVL